MLRPDGASCTTEWVESIKMTILQVLPKQKPKANKDASFRVSPEQLQKQVKQAFQQFDSDNR